MMDLIGFVLVVLVLLGYASFYVYGTHQCRKDAIHVMVLIASFLAVGVLTVISYLSALTEKVTDGLVPSEFILFGVFTTLAVTLIFVYKKVIRIGRKHVANFGLPLASFAICLAVLVMIILLTR